MKKIRLNPESLEVLSFDVAGDAQERPGTIEGHAAALISYSCDRPCKPRTYLSDCDAC